MVQIMPKAFLQQQGEDKPEGADHWVEGARVKTFHSKQPIRKGKERVKKRDKSQKGEGRRGRWGAVEYRLKEPYLTTWWEEVC